MPTYLVIHTPRTDISDDDVFPPSDLAGLARDHGSPEEHTQWITTWSPDLRDERHFSLWKAKSAQDIEEVMDRYHVLSEMTHHAVCVQAWGPDDIASSDDRAGA